MRWPDELSAVGRTETISLDLKIPAIGEMVDKIRESQIILGISKIDIPGANQNLTQPAYFFRPVDVAEPLHGDDTELFLSPPC